MSESWKQFAGTGVWEEVNFEFIFFFFFWRNTRPISLIKLKGVTNQVFVDEELIYFCFYWTHRGFLRQSTFTTLYILVTNQKHAKKPIVPRGREKKRNIFQREFLIYMEKMQI